MCSLWMIGVAGQGLGLLAFPRWSTREGGGGGRENVMPVTNACSYRSVIKPKESTELELLLTVYSGLFVYSGLLKQDGEMQLEYPSSTST